MPQFACRKIRALVRLDDREITPDEYCFHRLVETASEGDATLTYCHYKNHPCRRFAGKPSCMRLSVRVAARRLRFRSPWSCSSTPPTCLPPLKTSPKRSRHCSTADGMPCDSGFHPRNIHEHPRVSLHSRAYRRPQKAVKSSSTMWIRSADATIRLRWSACFRSIFMK